MPDLDLFADPPAAAEPHTCGNCGACEPSFVGGNFCALSCQTVSKTDEACGWWYSRAEEK